MLSLGASLPQDYGGLLSPGLSSDSSFPKLAFERQEEGEESKGGLIGSPPPFIFLIIINPGLETQHSREERRQGTESQEQLLQWARLPYPLLLFLWSVNCNSWPPDTSSTQAVTCVGGRSREAANQTSTFPWTESDNPPNTSTGEEREARGQRSNAASEIMAVMV